MKRRHLAPLAALLLTACPVKELRIYALDAGAQTDAPLDVATDRADAPLDALADQTDAPFDAPGTARMFLRSMCSHGCARRPCGRSADRRSPCRCSSVRCASDYAPVDRVDASPVDVPVDRVDASPVDVPLTDVPVDRADVPSATQQLSCLVAGTPGCGLIDAPGATLTLGDNSVANSTPEQSSITVSGSPHRPVRGHRRALQALLELARLHEDQGLQHRLQRRRHALGLVAGPPRTSTETVGCNWTLSADSR